MTHGTGSTLILRPKGGSAITFNMSGATTGVTTYTFIVDAGRIDLNEEARWQWTYEQNSTGGRVSGDTQQLIPLTLAVIIKAATSDYRKFAYRVLQTALMNRLGGTLQYKPEGSGAGVLDTYYHYVASKPPRLLDDPGNRWDSDADADGFYSLQLEVELLTQPVATSDPDNPVTVSSLGGTLHNWYDTGLSQSNRLSVSSGDLDGSLPALVRLLITPNSSQRLGRVIVFRRSAADGTLANVKTVYEAEAAALATDTAAWTQVASTFRGAGYYMRCYPNPDANGVAQGLKFTLTYPNDCKGRFAVFGVGYDDAQELGVWTHQVQLYNGNAAQVGEADYYAPVTQGWCLIYAGEFELPLAELSDLTSGYDAGPYLEWRSTRASGSSEFRLDAVMLIWVSDSLGADGDGTALDVVCDDLDADTIQGGVQATDKLLLENLPGRAGIITARAYVVASDNDITRILKTAPRGDFVELDPAHNHLLIFLQERASGEILHSDDFEGYKALYWLPVAEMESDEDWGYGLSTAEDETSEYVEGAQARKLVFDSTTSYFDQRWMGGAALDLSDDDRFTADDYVVIAFYLTHADIDNIQVQFRDVSTFFYYEWDSLVAGWNYVYVKRSALLESGVPDWAHINALLIQGELTAWYGSNEELIYDCLRIEKADPDSASVPNATGDVWDFQPTGGKWTVVEETSEAGVSAALACLDTESGVEKVALLDKSLSNDVRIRVRMQAKRATGTVGVLWRAGSDCLTEGAEDGYALTLNTGGDTMNVLRYTAGTPTTLYTTGMTLEADKWYTVGVQSKSSTHKVFVALTSNIDFDDSAVFAESHLKQAVVDATYGTGKMGVLSTSTLGRFDNVLVENISDRVVPADQITVSGKAVFRTISPFD